VQVAFAGKEGSGKTTLPSLFVRYLAGQGLPVVPTRPFQPAATSGRTS